MRSVIINLITICIFGTLISFHLSHTGMSATDREIKYDFAQIWENAIKQGDARGVYVAFKAIELKQDERFEPALKKFIESKTKTDSFEAYAHAIIAYDKIGARGAQNHFNALLERSIFDSNNVPGGLLHEKRETLRYMLARGRSPGGNALDQIEKEIAKLIDMNLPAMALDLAVPLKLFGHDLKKDQEAKLRELITNKWRNINPEDLYHIGIQPDWEKMWKSRDASVQGQILAQMTFLAADENSFRKISKLASNADSKETYLGRIKPLIDASLGDKNAIKSLKEKITLDQSEICKYAPEKLPDDVLIKIAGKSYENFSYLPGLKLFTELEKRGQKQRLRELKENINSIAEGKADKDNRFPNNEFHAIWILRQYDPNKALNAYDRLLENDPDKYHIATQVLQIPHDASDQSIENWEKQLINRPDVVSKAISIIIDASDNPSELEKTTFHAAPLSKESIYFDKNSAFAMMMLLPDDSFIKYFATVKPGKFTSSAYLTGKYFDAKWPGLENQEQFYRKYSMKNK